MSNLLAAVNNVFAPQLNANFDHYEKLLNEKDPGENDFGILPTGTQVSFACIQSWKDQSCSHQYNSLVPV